MKQLLKTLLVFGVSTAMIACNNATDKKADSAATTDTTTASKDTTALAPPPAPVFKPFDVMEISHTVKDYDKWRPAFNTDSVARRASGLEDIVVGREEGHPNNIMIALMASDVSKAKAFAADPRLKDVMQKNGVVSKPVINYWHVIRYNPDSKEKQWVEVTHKVKDFDKWLKVFDEEGTATRASFGLIDVVMARGIADSNLVQLVFDIKDMAKSKARMNDPALKKIMMDAGVIGAPKMVTFKTADQ